MNKPHVVADAVVHPYDLGATNRLPEAGPQLDAVYAAHTMATGPEQAEFELTRQEFFSDFPFEAMAWSLFVEAGIDIAVIHSLPSLGFTYGPVTEPDRAAAFREQHPQRFLMYATVDTPVLGSAIEQLREQVESHDVDGLKLYPSFFYDGDAVAWRLDDPDLGIPLLEAAREMGIRNVAIHKALWLDPAPRSAFSPVDLSGALEHFGDMNFFMIHAGMAFLDETVALLGRHENLYATLESTLAYAVVRPRLFAQVTAQLLAAAGPERLLFGSGTNLMHPAPILDAFRSFEVPESLVAEGAPRLTEEGRAAILGGNLLRTHGLSPSDVLGDIEDDVFARAKRQRGRAEPWSVLRRGAGVGAGE